MRIYASLLVLLLFVLQPIPNSVLEVAGSNTNSAFSKSSGVDLTVTDISYSYTNPTDQQKYQMFSSNHPIQNFNKPEQLFVIDAVINTPINIEVTVRNIGNANSPGFDLTLIVRHNEYQNFEISNLTNQVTSIRAASSATSTYTLTPTYSGNHTISVTPTMSLIDDNPTNDELLETFTVASHYFNCDDLSLWTVGQGWGTSSDAALSLGSACHIGNGQYSTYQPNLISSLVTPVMDMSDAISNPTRTNGIAYFFTGSIASGDSVKTYSMSPSNSWVELVSISGTIDNDFSGGSDWQTASINDGGIVSPLIPSPQQNFHANSQFRFGFSSDAVNDDIGLWIDDIVIIYDQKLRPSEYGINAVGVSLEGAVPGSWGKATIELTNTGNVSETFTPKLSNVPSEWQYYFSQTSGVSITESNGIYLERGQTKIIELHYQPDTGSNQGFYPIDFSASSKTHQSISGSAAIQLEVIPDRIPEFLPMVGVVRCAPGSTCVTTASITNSGGATDVFSLSLDYTNLPVGWSVSLSWNQATNILVQPGFSVPIMLTYTVGSDAVPDSVGAFDLVATSQNDSSRSDTLTIEIVASMVSDASVYPDISPGINQQVVAPGESITVTFEVHNNASVQDIFDTNVEFDSTNDWILSDVTPAKLYLNAGDKGTFSAKITAPQAAQVGDDCPAYIATIVSQRSGEIFVTSSIDNLLISQVNNIKLDWLQLPDELIPGELNIMPIRLTNLGNGPVSALVEVSGIPQNWGVFYSGQDGSLSNIVQLGEISELSAQKDVEVGIQVPNGIPHSLVFDVEISAKPNQYGDDNDLTDNYISATLVTKSVRNLSLSITSQIISAGIGNSTSINLDIQNFGNVDEQNLQILASLSSDDYLFPFMAYLSIGNTGLAYDLNKYHPLVLEKNSSRAVRLDIVIPSDIDIGSNIVFDFTLISAGNEFEPLTHRTNIAVDYVREVTLDLSGNNFPVTGDFGYLWVNISTISTIDEIYQLQFSLPDGWGLICDSEVIDTGRLSVNSKIISSISREESVVCELINDSENGQGVVRVTLSDSSGTLLASSDANYEFISVTKESASTNVLLVGGVVSFSSILVILSIMLLLRRNRKEYDYAEEVKPQITGPPISGPPISTASVSQQAPPINDHATNQVDGTSTGPAVPETGLPPGWTMEQWQYYGQQYLDMNKRQ